MCNKFKPYSIKNNEEYVCPSMMTAVITSDGIKNMKWGFTAFDKKRLLINARSESVYQKITFASLIKSQRCLIPVHMYYEWDQHKQCYHFSDVQNRPIYLAGIYRIEADGQACFVVLTRQSEGNITAIHDRMPVVLPSLEYCDLWLKSSPISADILSLPPMVSFRITKTAE